MRDNFSSHPVFLFCKGKSRYVLQPECYVFRRDTRLLWWLRFFRIMAQVYFSFRNNNCDTCSLSEDSEWGFWIIWKYIYFSKFYSNLLRMDGEWWRRFLLEFVKSLEFIWIFATGVITGLTDGISWANVCEMTGASLNWKIIICIPASFRI